MEDSQVLQELVRQRAELLKRLDAVNFAIVAFGGTAEGIEINAPVTEVPKKETPPPARDAPSNPEAANYNPLWFWKEKILFALREIKAGFVPDIASALKKYEPDLRVANAIQSITWYASNMYRSKELDARRVKNKNQYFLPGNPPEDIPKK